MGGFGRGILSTRARFSFQAGVLGRVRENRVANLRMHFGAARDSSAEVVMADGGVHQARGRAREEAGSLGPQEVVRTTRR